MNKFKILVYAGLAMGALLGSDAYASPTNLPPPPGWIYTLDGQPLVSSYTQYTTSFVATDALTNVTFALRNDPAFIHLDDISVTTGGGPNLLTNGGFETGSLGPWTYLNQWGAAFGGQLVCGGGGHGGSNCYWYNGAVQAYDAISQAISTTIGDTYTIDFFAFDDSGLTGDWSALSTNGDVTDTGGNGINMTVYAGAIPPPTNVPEPAALGMFGLGTLLIGLFVGLRRRMA